MEIQFTRSAPCYDRLLFVLSLDRKRMKERILIGDAQQIRLRLEGSEDASVLYDATRPLGTLLVDFEHDEDGAWNRLGLMPLHDAPHKSLETAGAGMAVGRLPARAVSERRSHGDVSCRADLEWVSAGPRAA